MERLREDILDLGQADGHVLIDGETGTGKTHGCACAARSRVAAPARKFVLDQLQLPSKRMRFGANGLFGPM